MAVVTIHDIKKKSAKIAEWLFKNYPGYQLNIPKKQSSMTFNSTEERNRVIRNLYYSAGKSYKDIAEIVGLSKDSVRKIIANVYRNKS